MQENPNAASIPNQVSFDAEQLETAVPNELRLLHQWVCWKYEMREGKATKVPYDAGAGGNASVSDPKTWNTFDSALRACESGNHDGIGFIFTKDDPFCGIDLDDCINAAGNVAPEAQAIINTLDSYAEISPSGTGIKIIVRAKLPTDKTGGRRQADGFGEIEMYHHGRYFCLTGSAILGTPLCIENRQEQIESLWHKYWTTPKPETNPPTPAPSAGLQNNDADLIARACNSSSKFATLWAGDTSAHGDDDSRADLALCSLIAFWTGAVPAHIDRIFQQSSLFREKWLRQDYRDATISKAIEGRTEFYKGGKFPEANDTTNTNDGNSCDAKGEELTPPPPAWLTPAEIMDNPRYLRGVGCVTTGYECLDELMSGGFRAGVHIIGGRTGSAKSTVATNMARRMSIAMVNVLLLCLEDSPTLALWRMHGACANVPLKILLDGATGHGPAIKALKAQRDIIRDLPLRLSDVRELKAIRQLIRMHAAANGKIVILDQVSKVKTNHLSASASTYERVSEVSEVMRTLADDLCIPIVMICQLNRSGSKSDEINITDLRDSGMLEQDAISVLLLDKATDPPVATGQDKPFAKAIPIKLGKNRFGPAGQTVEVVWYPRLNRIDDHPDEIMRMAL